VEAFEEAPRLHRRGCQSQPELRLSGRRSAGPVSALSALMTSPPGVAAPGFLPWREPPTNGYEPQRRAADAGDRAPAQLAGCARWDDRQQENAAPAEQAGVCMQPVVPVGSSAASGCGAPPSSPNMGPRGGKRLRVATEVQPPEDGRPTSADGSLGCSTHGWCYGASPGAVVSSGPRSPPIDEAGGGSPAGACGRREGPFGGTGHVAGFAQEASRALDQLGRRPAALLDRFVLRPGATAGDGAAAGSSRPAAPAPLRARNGQRPVASVNKPFKPPAMRTGGALVGSRAGRAGGSVRQLGASLGGGCRHRAKAAGSADGQQGDIPALFKQFALKANA
jgi:hypothetical protein